MNDAAFAGKVIGTALCGLYIFATRNNTYWAQMIGRDGGWFSRPTLKFIAMWFFRVAFVDGILVLAGIVKYH